MMAINFRAVVRLTAALLPVLKAHPGSHLVNVSSVFGIFAPPGQAAYAASKFAVRGFTESLRHELAEDGVGVTVVHPGGIATRIAETARLGSGVSTPRRSPQGREQFAKLLRMPPEKAAAQIVAAIEKRRPRLLIGLSAKVPDVLVRLRPGTYWGSSPGASPPGAAPGRSPTHRGAAPGPARLAGCPSPPRSSAPTPGRAARRWCPRCSCSSPPTSSRSGRRWRSSRAPGAGAAVLGGRVAGWAGAGPLRARHPRAGRGALRARPRRRQRPGRRRRGPGRCPAGGGQRDRPVRAGRHRGERGDQRRHPVEPRGGPAGGAARPPWTSSWPATSATTATMTERVLPFLGRPGRRRRGAPRRPRPALPPARTAGGGLRARRRRHRGHADGARVRRTTVWRLP